MKTVLKVDLKFTEIVKTYVGNHFALNQFSPKTRQNYDSIVNAIEKFLIEANNNDILIKDLTIGFIEDFHVWLRNKSGIAHSARTIEIIKRIVKWAKMKGFVAENVLEYYKTNRGKLPDKVCLEKNELQEWIYSQIESTELKIAQDLYTFQAISGLSYGDLSRYKIIKDSFGEWIYCRRGKNNNEFWVPVDGVLKAIHEKYNGRLPRVRLNDYNLALRKIAGLLQIDKHLTSHTARKTFATLSYEKGYSIESIADMMGHTTTETTRKHYLKKSRKRLEMEVRMLA